MLKKICKQKKRVKLIYRKHCQIKIPHRKKRHEVLEFKQPVELNKTLLKTMKKKGYYSPTGEFKGEKQE